MLQFNLDSIQLENNKVKCTIGYSPFSPVGINYNRICVLFYIRYSGKGVPNKDTPYNYCETIEKVLENEAGNINLEIPLEYITRDSNYNDLVLDVAVLYIRKENNNDFSQVSYFTYLSEGKSLSINRSNYIERWYTINSTINNQGILRAAYFDRTNYTYKIICKYRLFSHKDKDFNNLPCSTKVIDKEFIVYEGTVNSSETDIRFTPTKIINGIICFSYIIYIYRKFTSVPDSEYELVSISNKTNLDNFTSLEYNNSYYVDTIITDKGSYKDITYNSKNFFAGNTEDNSKIRIYTSIPSIFISSNIVDNLLSDDNNENIEIAKIVIGNKDISIYREDLIENDGTFYIGKDIDLKELHALLNIDDGGYVNTFIKIKTFIVGNNNLYGNINECTILFPVPEIKIKNEILSDNIIKYTIIPPYKPNTDIEVNNNRIEQSNFL